jgi:enterochelin esterase-like enzyme
MWMTQPIGANTYRIWQPPEAVRFAMLWLNAEEMTAPPGWAVVRWPSDTWHLTKAEDAELLEIVLPWIQQQWNLPAKAVALAGSGAGGQAALRWGFRYPGRVGAVAAIQPSIEFEQLFNSGTFLDELYPRKEAARQANAILALSSAKVPPFVWISSDPPDELWHRGADRLREKLNANGHEHRFVETSCTSDDLWKELVPAMQALSRRLM